MGQLDGVEHGVVVHLVGAGLDHGHQIGGGGHRNVHVRLFLLFGGGVDDIFPVHQAHHHAGDGAIPGDVGDGNGDGGADHGGDFRCAVGIHRHHGADHRHVVAHILGEEGADGAVDDPGGQDRLFAGPALPALEGAGDLAHGIELFLKIHGEGEEIHSFPGLGGHGDGAQHHRFTVAHQAGAACQLGDFAGFHLQGAAGQGGFEYLIIFEHGEPPILFISIGAAAGILAIKPTPAGLRGNSFHC